MAILHNRISQKELKERMLHESEPRTTLSFYRYFSISDPGAFRNNLYAALNELNVFGRIYVAHEGINAQLSVPQTRFEELQNLLNKIKGLENLRLNIAVDNDGKSFWVLKVKVREKIVSDGITDPTFNMNNRGKYVTAEEFNRLSEDPETIVVDMRNHYEFEVGHFERAVEVPSDTFREQLPMVVDMLKEAKDKNVIMYCTGGIRCEKASAWMLHQGFQNVFHLEGGIINYVNQVREKKLPTKFHGKNFVFDDRLGERVTHEIIATCHQCGKPADTHINCANEACHLLFIQCDDCADKYERCCSTTCQEVIHLPEDQQKLMRKGIDKGRHIFNKSRSRIRPRLQGK
ncbi:MAG: rhodanese-related sulfurtransferase [Flavisolibacter sp.]